MTTMMLLSVILIFQTNDEQLLREWLTLIIAVKYECKKHVNISYLNRQFSRFLCIQCLCFLFFINTLLVRVNH